MSAHPWADPAAEPTFRIVCDQPQTWLNSNRVRGHWATTDPLRRYWRDLGVTLTRKAMKGRPSFERVQVVFTFHRADRREFDPGNLAPTSKAFLDGMVDAGLVPSDTWRHVVGPDHRYGPPDGQRRMVVDVFDLGSAS